jgi:SRSO17 transposase
MFAGLIGPGDRKSVGPMAERVAPGDYDQLHHFVSDGVWAEAPLERELAIQADRLVGGAGAFLVIDDTPLPKKGTHSVGVAPQYASALGKTANCQTLVSLTLARGEVPVMVGLRLFLPETWTGDEARLERAGVPAEYRSARTQSEIAHAELDRLIAAGGRPRKRHLPNVLSVKVDDMLTQAKWRTLAWRKGTQGTSEGPLRRRPRARRRRAAATDRR